MEWISCSPRFRFCTGVTPRCTYSWWETGRCAPNLRKKSGRWGCSKQSPSPGLSLTKMCLRIWPVQRVANRSSIVRANREQPLDVAREAVDADFDRKIRSLRDERLGCVEHRL